MFGPLNNYLQEQDLDRGKCVGVCTKGDAGIIGRLSGITVKIRENTNKDLSIHCIINQEPISVTKLSPELNDLMNGTVEIVSGIRGRALHSRLYEARSDGVGSLHHRLCSCRNMVAFESTCSQASSRVEERIKSVFT